MAEELFATISTDRGDIVVKLLADHAPKTVDNFVGLANGSRQWTDPASGQQSSDPFYDGLGFHRVIDGFMIQGGCPIGDGTGGPGYQFDDEIHPDLSFDRAYLLAMANSGKKSGRGTNGSQFFITVSPTPHLNGKHTIFGEVADETSRAVICQIASTATTQDRPDQPVTIEQVVVERRG